MATLTLTLDTEMQTCTAAVNGADVPDVDGLRVYNYGSMDRPYFTFTLESRRQEQGVSYVNTVCASSHAPDDKACEASSLGKDLVEYRVESAGTISDLFARAFAAGKKGAAR